MSARLAPSPPRRSDTRPVVVYAHTAIATVAALLEAAGARAARVEDPRGDRAGVVVAQDVREARRLGAGREPVSRLVVWSSTLGAAPATTRAPLRLVRRIEDVEAVTRRAPGAEESAASAGRPASRPERR